MMKKDILIGIDAGTSVIKSVAFSLSGEQIASAGVPNAYVTLPGGCVEQDMARTWADTVKSIILLCDKVPNLAERVISIAVTGQGDGMWLIDKEGEPVAPAWLWLDSRSASIAEEFIATEHYASHYQRTGTGLNACQMSTQLVWMSRHRPNVLKKAVTAFHCKDWLYFKLTGERATDPSEANFTFGNFRSRKYEPHILDQLGSPETKRTLPPILDGIEQSHGLSSSAAELTGLKTGLPVCLGYVDIICTGLGGGLFDGHGRVGCTIIGSTGMHMRMTPKSDDVKLNAAQTGYTMPLPVPGLVAQIQSNMASTLNIDWLTDMAIGILVDQGIVRTRSEILQNLDDRVLQRPAGRDLFHPYISTAGERGPFMDSSARAMLSILGTGHEFADILRAVYEGICFASRDCYAAMGNIPDEIRITGGGARSQAMRVILASVLNANIRSVERDEGGAAGAAMISAVQQKLYPTMQDCADDWVNAKLSPFVKPDHALVQTYDRAFDLYQNTRIKMQPIWREMKIITDKQTPVLH
jgi:erythritol kinase (D-erythritol 1-phosphate-forming)